MIFEGDRAVFLREKIKHSQTVHFFLFSLKKPKFVGKMVFKIGGRGGGVRKMDTPVQVVAELDIIGKKCLNGLLKSRISLED